MMHMYLNILIKKEKEMNDFLEEIGKLTIFNKKYSCFYDTNKKQVYIKINGEYQNLEQLFVYNKSPILYCLNEVKDYFYYERNQRLKQKIPKQTTPCLTEDEYQYLEEAIRNNLNLTMEEKEWLKSYKTLILGSPIDLQELYFQYRYLKIEYDTFEDELFQAKYDHLKNVLRIHKDIPLVLLNHAKRHEGIHIHQHPFSEYGLSLLEGFTELLTREYQEYDFKDYSYLSDYNQEVLIVKMLCELFEPKKIKEYIMTGSFDKLFTLFRYKMTTKEIYQLFVWSDLYTLREQYVGLDPEEILVSIYTLLYCVLKRCHKKDKEKNRIFRYYLCEAKSGKMKYYKSYFINHEEGFVQYNKETKNCYLKKINFI